MKIVSKPNCGLCITVKIILQKKKVPYIEYSPESDEGTMLLNIAQTKELPVIILDDGSIYFGIHAYNYAKSVHPNYKKEIL